MGCKLGKIDTSSNILAKELNDQPLEDKRFNNDILFLCKLLNNLIDCPELLADVPLNILLYSICIVEIDHVARRMKFIINYTLCTIIILCYTMCPCCDEKAKDSSGYKLSPIRRKK